MFRFVLAACATAVALPVAANAATTVYDIASAFSPASPGSAWAYGTGTGGRDFSAFTTSHAGCFGIATIACQTNGGDTTVPIIGENLGVAPVTVGGTISLPTDELWMHPADGGGASDAVVQFTAPTTGIYDLSGAFTRLSNAANDGHGNGVDVGVYLGGNAIYQSNALAAPSGLTSTSSASFSSLRGIHLIAGDKVSFAVNNNGNYQYDSTGLAGKVTAHDAAPRYTLYDAFGSGNASAAVWSYGTGAGGADFTAFSAGYGSGCFGMTTFACQTVGGNNAVAGVGRNTGSTAIPFATTAMLPRGELWMHPSDSAGATDAVVRFVAPTAGSYEVRGLFERLSLSQLGNGVKVAIYNGTTSIFSSDALASPVPYSQNVRFNKTAVQLAQGDVLSFVVNNNGDFRYDSTGLQASVTNGVPEPATWGMMLVGFGAVGATMRRRKAIAAA